MILNGKELIMGDRVKSRNGSYPYKYIKTIKNTVFLEIEFNGRTTQRTLRYFIDRFYILRKTKNEKKEKEMEKIKGLDVVNIWEKRKIEEGKALIKSKGLKVLNESIVGIKLKAIEEDTKRDEGLDISFEMKYEYLNDAEKTLYDALKVEAKGLDKEIQDKRTMVVALLKLADNMNEAVIILTKQGIVDDNFNVISGDGSYYSVADALYTSSNGTMNAYGTISTETAIPSIGGRRNG